MNVTVPFARLLGLEHNASTRNNQVIASTAKKGLNLRLQNEGDGVKEALRLSTAKVHRIVTYPTSSNPVLHEYVALSPTELPVKFIMPFSGSMGRGHRAVEKELL